VSFIYENTYHLTDKGIGWVDTETIEAHLVSVEPTPDETSIHDVMATVAVTERTFEAGVASCGRLMFQGVPANTAAAGIVFTRDALPLAYQGVTGAETSAQHEEDLLFPEGEVFRL
jgi:hypothetical protein